MVTSPDFTIMPVLANTACHYSSTADLLYGGGQMKGPLMSLLCSEQAIMPTSQQSRSRANRLHHQQGSTFTTFHLISTAAVGASSQHILALLGTLQQPSWSALNHQACDLEKNRKNSQVKNSRVQGKYSQDRD